MTQRVRSGLVVAGATLAVLISAASAALAYGEVAELIDPDCQPEKALEAQPELVEPADGTCPPGEADRPTETPDAGMPALPDPILLPSPDAAPTPAPLPVAPPAAQTLPPEQSRTQKRPARGVQAERLASSGGAEAPAPRARRDRRRRSEPERAGGGVAPPSSPVIAPGGSGMPAFLVQIYQEAGGRYGVRWEILAAINEIESDYGRNLNVSSAGAVGWMQFMPATWSAYGTDASGDGVADPYDPVDAIHSAARYLAASGYSQDVRGALFAYNHANWYVDWVLLRAETITADGVVLPEPLPRARRLDRRFAADLRRLEARLQLPWELVLAVLRARGHTGRVPATAAELSAVARRLVSLGARRHPGQAVKRLAPSRPLRAQRIVALAHYHKAVGLTGLVRGLRHVKLELARRVLQSERLVIYPAGRADIAVGMTDARVLVLLRYLASRYGEVTVTSLTTGHGFLTASGNVSLHSYGRAVDISALGGTPVLGNQGPGGITDQALKSILLLPQEVQPDELISLLAFGGPSFALADHADHIHVGY